MRLDRLFARLGWGLLAFLVGQAAVAQPAPAPDLRSYGVAEGLSQSTVYALAQDAVGFLWAGTADGLNRFDGYGFKTFRRDAHGPSSLSNNTVRQIVLDPAGRLWIGTDDGLNRYDPATETFEVFHPGAPEAPLASAVTALAPATSGGMWVGTAYGLFHLTPGTGQFARVALDPAVEDVVRAVLDDGALWVGTDSGLWRRDVTGHEESAPSQVVSARPVYVLMPDRDGGLWAGTEGGLLYIPAAGEEPRFQRLTPLPGVPVRALTRDDEGRLWCGGSRGLLGVFDPATGRFQPYDSEPGGPLPSNAVQALHTDRSGLVWVGTDGAGLVRINPHPPKFTHVGAGPRALRHAFVKAIHEDRRGDLWVGTLKGGLHRQEARSGRWRVYPYGEGQALGRGPASALLERRDGTFWVGTEDGLYERRGEHFVRRGLRPGGMRAPSEAVTVLLEDRAGALWVGTQNGLYRRPPGASGFEPVFAQGGLKSSWVLALYEDRAGALWIGTHFGGMARYTAEGGLQDVPLGDGAPEALSRGGVRAFAEDGQGRLWVGTQEGLHRLDRPSGRFTSFHERDGLPSAFIYGILSDATGALWLSTNQGLVRVTFTPEGRPGFRSYGVEDGVQSAEFNTGAYHRSRRGEVFFGGIAGFNRFFPEAVRDNPRVPPVVLTAFKKFDEPHPLGVDPARLRTIHLAQGDAVVSFEFAALEFTHPEKNRYAYRLEGFDREWIAAGTRREARYTNLPPGAYTFRVKAANHDGVWNEAGLALGLVVPTPYWRQWWFLLGSVLLFAGTVGGVVRFVSTRRLQRALERLEAQRALERERARISADMHDHVGASLTRIMLMSELARRERAPGAAVEAHLEQIAETANTVIQEMDGIVWAVNPANDTMERFALYLCACVQELCAAASVRCRLALPEAWPDVRVPPDVRHNVLLVVREAINNAVRHAAPSEVRVRLELRGGEMEVQIEDDGMGFDPQACGAFGNGLANMRRRIDEVGGSIVLETAPGAGTRLTLALLLSGEVGFTRSGDGWRGRSWLGWTHDRRET